MTRIGPSPHFGLRRAGRALACLVLVFLAGCSADEPIEQYRVPKEPDRGTRMLTAVFSRPDATWFIKLAGPKAAVAEVRDTFEQFVASTRFTDDGKEMDWTVPSGWKREPAKKGRVATFRLPTGGPEPLEVAVNRFGPETGSWLENVNRWRAQLGVGPVTEERANESVRELQTEQKQPYKLVDLSGPAKLREGMMAPPTAPPGPTSGGGLTFEVPSGWKEIKPPKAQFAVRELRTGDGEDTPIITFTPARGDPATNLNRWRMQVGLPELSEEELVKAITPIEVSGQQAALADFAGPKKRIIGVIIQSGDEAMFIKMTGNPEAVGAQRLTFETFLKSVRMSGEKAQQ